MTTLSLDLAESVVNFNTYAPDLLGNNFQRVQIKGFLDHKSAFQYIDVPAKHANVFPYLPPGTPNDFTKYLYVKVQFPNGKEDVLGVPWINQSTLQVVEETTFLITIRGKQPSDEAAIRTMLLANQHTDFTIELQ